MTIAEILQAPVKWNDYANSPMEFLQMLEDGTIKISAPPDQPNDNNNE